MYKTKLQELCHEKRWGLPRYSAMKDGPDHIPSFKASVSVNGITFHSLGPTSSSKLAQNEAAMLAFLHFTSPTNLNQLCESQLQQYDTCMKATSSVDDGQLFLRPAILSTSKEAEQVAAKVALMSLPLDCSQKSRMVIISGDSGLYKNLLIDLAHREGFCKPTYKTIRSGTVHMPTFFSIVEVEGKEFHGEPMKSKKLAEQNAAKVAYLALQDYKAEEKEVDMVDDGMLPNIVKVSNDISYPPSLEPSEEEDMMKRIESLQSSEADYESSSTKELDLSSLSVSEINKEKTPEATTYLLQERFRVYTSYPDLPFPKGITILPVREDRWVAVSLEFPNEIHK